MGKGTLVAYIGAMGSGKTKNLIDLYNELQEEGVSAAVFKPLISREGEDDDFVYARDGRKAPATPVGTLDDIPKIIEDRGLDAILIDELQFFEDYMATEILDGMAMSGIEVYVFGLDVTAENETFGIMGDVLAHADSVYKLHTPCVKCGEPARISKFVGGDKDGVIRVGDLGEYEPQCRSCYYGWVPSEPFVQDMAKITLSGDGYSFSCDVAISKVEELGYSLDTIIQELGSVEKVMDFLSKIRGET